MNATICIKVYFTDIKIETEKFQGFSAKILNKTKTTGTENDNTWIATISNLNIFTFIVVLQYIWTILYHLILLKIFVTRYRYIFLTYNYPEYI